MTPDSTRAPQGYHDFATGCGAARLDGWTTVAIAGGDRATFLQSFCTNDVLRLSPGEGCEAFLTDVKGKTLSHFVSLTGDDESLLLAPPGQGERITSHLDRYVIREDVQLSDDSDRWSWFALSRAAAVAIGYAAAELPNRVWEHAAGAAGHPVARLIRCGMTWCESYLACVRSDDLPAQERSLREACVVACSAEAWQAVRIESGWPLWGVDFDDGALPQEVGRDAAAISFTKGCYLGQETVARIDSLGRVNRRLATVRIDGDQAPPTGASLMAGGEQAGQALSACWSPQLGAPLALAMLRRAHSDVGARLTCEGRPATVVETPAVAAP